MIRLSVLHVAQSPDSGVTNVAAGLAADQAERGFVVYVASPRESSLRTQAEAVGLAHFEWEATRSPGISVVRETAALAAIIARIDPDLVHLHSAKAGLAGRLALRRRRATIFQPHAWSFQAVEGAARRAALTWERIGARWADALVCVSRDERTRGQEAGVRGRYALVPNGVDLERLQPASDNDRARARRELGLEARPTVLLLGRLFRQKGQDVMLRSWPSVRVRVPDAELLLVGEGPERAALESLATEGVRFCGGTSRVEPWLAAADVVVLPSRWEGMSLVAMEAMARGRSVVATDVSGMREALGPDSGAVVAQGDLGGLVNAIVERLASAELADAEGRAGRRRVEERHDALMTNARMAELYAAVAERRR